VRGRWLKPGFWKNEDLARLQPFTRLLFAGLWGLADCEGRLKDQPARIRAEVFPYEPGLEVDVMLQELAAGADPFLVRYTVDGVRLLEIVHFDGHQPIHPKERKSYAEDKSKGLTIPPPPKDLSRRRGQQRSGQLPATVQPVSGNADAVISDPDTDPDAVISGRAARAEPPAEPDPHRGQDSHFSGSGRPSATATPRSRPRGGDFTRVGAATTDQEAGLQRLIETTAPRGKGVESGQPHHLTGANPALRKSKLYQPTVADIAEVSWGSVLRVAKQKNPAREAMCDAPVQRAVRAVGGWDALRGEGAADLKDRFIAAYTGETPAKVQTSAVEPAAEEFGSPPDRAAVAEGKP